MYDENIIATKTHFDQLNDKINEIENEHESIAKSIKQ